MNYSDYPNVVHVGDIPRSMPLTVEDEDKAPVDIAEFDCTVLLFDPDKREIDTTGATLFAIEDNVLHYHFPLDRSLFLRQGIYVLHLRLSTPAGIRTHSYEVQIEAKALGQNS